MGVCSGNYVSTRPSFTPDDNLLPHSVGNYDLTKQRVEYPEKVKPGERNKGT